MAAISRAFAPPPRLFRTKPPPAFDEDDERGLPPDADDDDTAAHAVIAEHTAHRTNCADGGCTNTVPHPRCCGVPVHVILGMIKVCSISFFNRGFGRKTFVCGRISSLKKLERTTQRRQQRPRKRAKEKGKTSREKNMPAAASAARVTRSSAANKTRGAGEKRNQSRPPIINPEDEDEDEDKGDDDVDSEDSDSDDAPPEEVTRAVAEKETREEQLLKKRARETQQLAKEREKEKRVEKAKARTEAAAKRKREKEEKRKAEEEEEGKENEREEEEDEEEEGAEEDPDAFTLDDDIVDAVAASENQLKEKYLKDFHDTKSQRKKRKKQMKRERMREEAMGRESAKFTTRDGFDVVIRSKVDELAEMKANPKAVDFARRRLDAKHRRDERMLCDTRTGKIKNQFAVR